MTDASVSFSEQEVPGDAGASALHAVVGYARLSGTCCRLVDRRKLPPRPTEISPFLPRRLGRAQRGVAATENHLLPAAEQALEHADPAHI